MGNSSSSEVSPAVKRYLNTLPILEDMAHKFLKQHCVLEKHAVIAGGVLGSAFAHFLVREWGKERYDEHIMHVYDIYNTRWKDKLAAIVYKAMDTQDKINGLPDCIVGVRLNEFPYPLA